MNDEALEVISWNPDDHTDIPGFAHGITRYGGRWLDVSVSAITVEVDATTALDAVFAQLREIMQRETPQVDYFTLDLRVASRAPVAHPDAGHPA